MRDKTYYNKIVGAVLGEIRSQEGISKAKMADRMNIDERTYGRYEAGDSAPSLADFLRLLDAVDVPALPIIMRHLYPERYGAETGADRRALADYILEAATDRDIEQLDYIVHGAHGSPLSAQLQMFCALDHLPMDARLMVAKLTINAWEIETARGHIINADDVLPDIELLRAAIIKAQAAVIAGRGSYSTTE